MAYGIDTIQNLHYGLIHVGLPTSVNLKYVKLPCIKNEFIPHNYELCKNGDVAFADASEDTNDVAKAIEFTDLDNMMVVCGLHTIHGRDKGNLTISGFKGYAFASPAFHNQIRRIAQGTKVFSISNKNFDECVIGIPSKEEQRKIADLFTLIDERIKTQIGAIEKLKSLISSLNDKLQFQFCNEVNLSFSEIGNDYSGLSGKSANDFGRGKPYIPYTNIYANTFVDDNQFDLVEINEGEHQCRVLNGDVLFTLSSEVPEEVCVGSVYLGNEKELYLNSFCFGVHINSNKIHSPYLAYFVKSSIFRHTVYPLAQGSTRFNLQKSDFLKRKFSFPNIEHQIKIANVLMAIDSKLKIEQKLLEQYKLQKQHLLSQMFV